MLDSGLRRNDVHFGVRWLATAFTAQACQRIVSRKAAKGGEGRSIRSIGRDFIKRCTRSGCFAPTCAYSAFLREKTR